jgi:hypothetical protein
MRGLAEDESENASECLGGGRRRREKREAIDARGYGRKAPAKAPLSILADNGPFCKRKVEPREYTGRSNDGN